MRTIGKILNPPPRAALLLVVSAVLVACGSSPFGLYAPSPQVPGTGGDGGIAGRYHPLGWAEPAAHGLALKLQTEDCRGCHGQSLDGDGSAGVGCDSCHAVGWRQNCTFCHGGQNDDTGAPPRALTGIASARFFPAHGSHLRGPRHPPYACAQCHTTPTDVLSPGHVFDQTSGRSEVIFAGGLSAAGTYQPGSCANLYCHGNGRGANGTAQTDGPSPSCGSCHADATSGGDAWDRMSGEHKKHLEKGFACAECHAGVVDGSGTALVDESRHVNGVADISLRTSTISFTAGRCTGTCHTQVHVAESW